MTAEAVSAKKDLVLALAIGPAERSGLIRDLALLPGMRLAAADDRDAELLVIASGAADLKRIASDALRLDCAVIVEAPDDLAALARLAAKGYRPIAPGRIGHTEAGKHLLDQLSAQDLGTIHSLYLAVRGPVASRSDNGFEALVWDAVCLVDDCLSEPLSALHVEGGSLFGPSLDTAVVVARSVSGTVATIEISCCLPPSFAASGAAEVELEIMGENATLRAAPYSRRVMVRSNGDPLDRFWGEDPLISMIDDWNTGVRIDGLRMQRRLEVGLAILDALHSSGINPPMKDTEPT